MACDNGKPCFSKDWHKTCWLHSINGHNWRSWSQYGHQSLIQPRRYASASTWLLIGQSGKRLYTGDDPIKMAELSLPKTKQSKNHFKSLNYDEMPSLFEEIDASSATTQTKLALQFTTTCCRTTEVLHSTWNEIDLVKAIWTIPAERMKAGETHSSPLRL